MPVSRSASRRSRRHPPPGTSTSTASRRPLPQLGPRFSLEDVTAILKVSIVVDGFQYDSSIMEHAEFQIATTLVFQCRQFGGQALQSSWQVFRTFQEFQGLDAQLRLAFPAKMAQLQPPRTHRRRTFFRLHRTTNFLRTRVAELNDYMANVIDSATMRLSRFLDPRAPLILRCFCNLDIGFGQHVTLHDYRLESCVLCLDDLRDGVGHSQDHARDVDEESKQLLSQIVRVDSSAKALEWELQQQQLHRPRWRADRARAETQQTMQQQSERHLNRHTYLRHQPRSVTKFDFDALAANRLDDRARNLAMCLKFECACQYSTFTLATNKMDRILRSHGYHATYRPRRGITALYCVLVKLQQYNDVDKKLYDALAGLPVNAHEPNAYGDMQQNGENSGSGEHQAHPLPRHHNSKTATMNFHHEDLHEQELDDDDNTSQQLTIGVERLRQALVLYGLLHGYVLESHFRMASVDLKKKMHAFKSDSHLRVGAIELVILCSMLDLSITLVTNDHDGTVDRIDPLLGMPPIRRGGRISITLGYILPTVFDVNGFYLLAEPLAASLINRSQVPMSMRHRMWLGVEELDRCLIAQIEEVMQSDLVWLQPFDHDLAELLNKAVLDAVWDDCQHNPSLFHLFQRQAQQFGKGRITGTLFVQYLEVAFGVEGAAYLVDFLLHVLPELELRKKLLRARWSRVCRRLTKRLAA